MTRRSGSRFLLAALAVLVFAASGCTDAAKDAAAAPAKTGAAASASNAGTTASPAADPSTADERAIYAVGLGLSRQLAPLHLSEAELAILQAGLADGMLGRPAKLDPQEFRSKIEELANRRSQAAAAGEKLAGAAFLKQAAMEEGAHTLPSGLVMKSLRAGTGGNPDLSQSVQVRYKGSLINGIVFDDNEKESDPATLAMGRFIPYWSQALQLMKEGEKAHLVCPPDLAYGDRGMAPLIPPGATLLFDVELVKVVR